MARRKQPQARIHIGTYPNMSSKFGRIGCFLYFNVESIQPHLMFYLLLCIAAISFLTHVGLLVTSLSAGRFKRDHYFWSHATLWLAGLLLFIVAIAYSGEGRSGAIDYFNTTLKKTMILVVTIALSIIADFMVKRLVVNKLPR